MTTSHIQDGRGGTPSGTPRLEYVTMPACRDCQTFEGLLERVVPDYPEVEIHQVAAHSPRGMALSVERGVLRFPVIVLNDEVIAVESITEAHLRETLTASRGG